MDWTVARQTVTTSAGIELCNGRFPVPGQSVLREPEPTVSLNLRGLREEKRGRFRDVSQSDYLPMGDVLFQPAQSHLESVGAGGDQRFLRVTFRPQAADGELDLAPDYTNPQMQRRLMHVRAPRVDLTMRSIVSELTAPGMAATYLLDAYAMALGVELTRYFSDAVPAEPRHTGGLAPWQARRIQERIHDEAAAPPTLTELAGLIRVSPRHLSRAYRISANETISEAVERVRQARAEQMILSREWPLKEVARRLGFASASSFSTAFRRRAGCSPQAFARRST